MNNANIFEYTYHYNIERSEDIPTSETVSWQTAFFSLAAIVTNTVMQNSGSVLRYPSSIRINMRVSSIICALDAIYAVLKFLYLMLHGCSARAAARHVWWDRFQDESDKRGSGVDKLWFWNMVTFAVGAAPQMVKIYAMSGIPGTKAIAALYFAPFLIMEAFRLTVGSEEIMQPASTAEIEEAKDKYDRIIERAIRIISGEIWQVLFSFWACGFLAIKMYSTLTKAWGVFPFVALIDTSLFLNTYLLLRAFRDDWSSHDGYRALGGFASRRKHAEKYLKIILGVGVVFMLGALVEIFLHLGTDWYSVDDGYHTLTVVSGMALSVSFFSSFIMLLVVLLRRYDKLSKAAGLHGHSFLFGAWIVMFPIGTLFSMFAYYAVQYDPAGTWRPAWTEKLG